MAPQPRPATADQIPVILRVFRLYSAARRSFAEQLGREAWVAELGLRPGCFAVLRSVAASAEPLSQKALSDLLGIDPSDIVALVDQLEQAGLVHRGRDAADRRRYALELTDAGWDAVERFDGVAAAVDERVLGSLSDSDRAEFSRLTNLALSGLADNGLAPGRG